MTGQPSEIRGGVAARALGRLGDRVDVHRAEPLVATIDDFLGDAECRMIIEYATGRMTRAVVAGDEGSQQSEGRTNDVLWVQHDETPAFRAIADRIAATVGCALSHAESFQVIHYLPGTFYRAHYDAFLRNTPKAGRLLARGGQRITTTLCYLNDVEEGGTTHFPHDDLAIEPQRGRLVVFNNCTGDGIDRDKAALHAGTPVVRGEKWAFNLWFRQHPGDYDPTEPPDPSASSAHEQRPPAAKMPAEPPRQRVGPGPSRFHGQPQQ